MRKIGRRSSENFANGESEKMMNFDELSADQILEKVMADGVVDADEVRALDCKLKQDWVVDRGEIELLLSFIG